MMILNFLISILTCLKQSLSLQYLNYSLNNVISQVDRVLAAQALEFVRFFTTFDVHSRECQHSQLLRVVPYFTNALKRGLELCPVLVIQIRDSAVKRIHIVEFYHFFHYVFHVALLLLIDLQGRRDLIDFLHELDQLSRAQFYNFTEDDRYLAIIRIENWLSFGTSALYHIIEHLSFEIN